MSSTSASSSITSPSKSISFPSNLSSKIIWSPILDDDDASSTPTDSSTTTTDAPKSTDTPIPKFNFSEGIISEVQAHIALGLSPAVQMGIVKAHNLHLDDKKDKTIKEPLVTVLYPRDGCHEIIDAAIRAVGQDQEADVLVIDSLELALGELGSFGKDTVDAIAALYKEPVIPDEEESKGESSKDESAQSDGSEKATEKDASATKTSGEAAKDASDPTSEKEISEEIAEKDASDSASEASSSDVVSDEKPLAGEPTESKASEEIPVKLTSESSSDLTPESTEKKEEETKGGAEEEEKEGKKEEEEKKKEEKKEEEDEKKKEEGGEKEEEEEKKKEGGEKGEEKEKKKEEEEKKKAEEKKKKEEEKKKKEEEKRKEERIEKEKTRQDRALQDIFDALVDLPPPGKDVTKARIIYWRDFGSIAKAAEPLLMRFFRAMHARRTAKFTKDSKSRVLIQPTILVLGYSKWISGGRYSSATPRAAFIRGGNALNKLLPIISNYVFTLSNDKVTTELPAPSTGFFLTSLSPSNQDSDLLETEQGLAFSGKFELSNFDVSGSTVAIFPEGSDRKEFRKVEERLLGDRRKVVSNAWLRLALEQCGGTVPGDTDILGAIGDSREVEAELLQDEKDAEKKAKKSNDSDSEDNDKKKKEEEEKETKDHICKGARLLDQLTKHTKAPLPIALEHVVTAAFGLASQPSEDATAEVSISSFTKAYMNVNKNAKEKNSWWKKNKIPKRIY